MPYEEILEFDTLALALEHLCDHYPYARVMIDVSDNPAAISPSEFTSNFARNRPSYLTYPATMTLRFNDLHETTGELRIKMLDGNDDTWEIVTELNALDAPTRLLMRWLITSVERLVNVATQPESAHFGNREEVVQSAQYALETAKRRLKSDRIW